MWWLLICVKATILYKLLSIYTAQVFFQSLWRTVGYLYDHFSKLPGVEKPKVGILIGSGCFPILIYLNKHHVNFCCSTWLFSACFGVPFRAKIYRGFPKFIKEKYFRMNFQFLHLKFIISTKSASEAAILRSRRFHRHPYQWPGSTMSSMAAMAISLILPL